MLRRTAHLALGGLALTLAASLGCSAAGGNQFTGATEGGGGGGATGMGGATSSSGSSDIGGGNIAIGGGSPGSGTTGTGGSVADADQVFAHSDDTLYRLDPTTNQVTVVGPFSGCTGVIDIAIDQNGVMFATTFDGLYRVDSATAKCSFIASGAYPNSLSFVPKGTVDPNAEALVGYEGTTYVRIDTTSGLRSVIGSLGESGYASSGDVVSVIGGGTYLTVNGNGCDDCIIEVDPKTGGLVKMIGPLGFSSVYGLAFWGGTAYGFDDAGDLFSIALPTSKTTLIDVPNKPAGLSYYGAGSTTAAPLEPPK